MPSLRRVLTVAAAILAIAAHVKAKRDDENWLEIPLMEFDLHPGPWFQCYLIDWMVAHNVTDPDKATSGIAKGAESGDYIWATATPEWDRDWFNSHGWEFPAKWVPFYYLGNSIGDPGGPCQLAGL